MKKIVLLGTVAFLLLLLGACSNSESTEEKTVNKKIFTEVDAQTTNEMVQFLEERMNEFQSKANSAIESGEIKPDQDGKLNTPLQKLAKETVLHPFLEKYPNGIIGDEGELSVSFAVTASTACPFGNCKYDGIAIPEINYDESNYSIYASEIFGFSQVIFQNVKSKFNEESRELEDSELRFVKTKKGELVMTSNPFISGEAFYLEKLDDEYSELKSEVPEDEVKAAQDEFRQEVKELLSNYPELQ